MIFRSMRNFVLAMLVVVMMAVLVSIMAATVTEVTARRTLPQGNLAPAALPGISAPA